MLAKGDEREMKVHARLVKGLAPVIRPGGLATPPAASSGPR